MQTGFLRNLIDVNIVLYVIHVLKLTYLYFISRMNDFYDLVNLVLSDDLFPVNLRAHAVPKKIPPFHVQRLKRKRV